MGEPSLARANKYNEQNSKQRSWGYEVVPAQLDLFCSLMVHICVAALDELNRQLVQLLKVVRGVCDLQGMCASAQQAAQHLVRDGVHLSRAHGKHWRLRYTNEGKSAGELPALPDDALLLPA